MSIDSSWSRFRPREGKLTRSTMRCQSLRHALGRILERASASRVARHRIPRGFGRGCTCNEAALHRKSAGFSDLCPPFVCEPEKELPWFLAARPPAPVNGRIVLFAAPPNTCFACSSTAQWGGHYSNSVGARSQIHFIEELPFLAANSMRKRHAVPTQTGIFASKTFLPTGKHRRKNLNIEAK